MNNIGIKSLSYWNWTNRLTFFCRPVIKILVRTRYKKSWAQYSKKKTTSEHALAYFDTYHKKVYEEQWPSLRLALLSTKKYGALLNNFSCECEDVEHMLEDLNATDIIAIARERHVNLLMKKASENKEGDELLISSNKDDINKKNEIDEEKVELELSDSQNIHEFIPSKKVYSDDELYAIEQHELSIYKYKGLEIPTIPELELTLPNKLKMFCHDIDDIANFPLPKADGLGKLGYYLQDAASILPVLALDIRPGDRILDLCAAPGGKMLAMLQTLLPYSVSANDNSDARRKRLIQVAKSYLLDSNPNLQISRIDGKAYQSAQEFEKVLVDVPCLTDRHVLHTDENNIFKPGRISERIGLPQTQLLLLKSGLNNVCVDGVVVYSTCTLANAQNDGVVESTLEYFHENTEKKFAVVDIAVFKELFHDIFFFYDQTRHGLLVVPNVRANFGPMYVCKMKRLQ